MKQYCRYCLHLAAGEGIWCRKNQKELTETYAKCPNRCKDFEFCEIDAFLENMQPYRPRTIQQKEPAPQAEDTITENQISLFQEGNMITATKDPNQLWVCPYNDACACNPKTRDCEKCGWNPKVAKARTEKIIKDMGVTLPEEE